MATLTVWKYQDSSSAQSAEDLLLDLQRRELVNVVDAAVVSWDPSHKKPHTRQLHSVAGAGALSGTFWGMLLGLIFFVPLLGAAVGAASGALGGALADVGIDDSFIDEVRSQVTPGTSALFVLTTSTVVDRVAEEFRNAGLHAQLIETNLEQQQEDALRTAFSV